MRKNVLVLHGTDCQPQGESSFWYPGFKQKLEATGDFNVAVPHLPTINHEGPNETMAALRETHANAPDILVTHSAGGPLALSLLQAGLIVKKTVMVAGFHRELANPGDNPVLQDNYDWPVIAANGGEFTYFNSTNDPWGCNEVQGREMFDHTGGTLIIRQDGHFGSTSFNQPYLSFPLLESVVIQ